MANYIKIPFALNPGRSMKIGSTVLTTSITTNSTDATNQPATDTPFTTSGDGTGATVQLTIAGNTVTVAGVTVAGDGYKVGDTLTFDKADIGGTTDVVITLNALDLDTVEGSETREYYFLDVDTLLAVDYNFATPSQMILWTNETRFITGANTVTNSSILLQFDTDPATNDGKIGQDLSETIVKAIEQPYSVPTVKFTDDVELLSVLLN